MSKHTAAVSEGAISSTVKAWMMLPARGHVGDKRMRWISKALANQLKPEIHILTGKKL